MFNINPSPIKLQSAGAKYVMILKRFLVWFVQSKKKNNNKKNVINLFFLWLALLFKHFANENSAQYEWAIKEKTTELWFA